MSGIHAARSVEQYGHHQRVLYSFPYELYSLPPTWIHDFTCIFIQIQQIKFLVSCPQLPWSHKKPAVHRFQQFFFVYARFVDAFQHRAIAKFYFCMQSHR